MAFIAILVIYPVLELIKQSFAYNDLFSLVAYREVFSNNHTYIELWNTFKLQVMVLIISWILGGVFALIRVKSNFRHKKNIDHFVFLSLIFPPFIFATSIKLFFGNHGFLKKNFYIFKFRL